MKIIHAYADWTRRQASTVNCGHYAVLAAVAAALVLMLATGSVSAALVAFAALVAVLCALAVGYAAWRIRASLARHPARAPEPEPEPVTDHFPAAWPAPGPDAWSPAAVLPAPDNTAAVDPVTAADLAAVLARAQVRQ